MKTFTVFSTFLVVVFKLSVEAESWQELSSNVFTHADIVWQVPARDVPKQLWVYRRVIPRMFSQAVISNSIMLASLQSRGFPVASTNDFYIWRPTPPGYEGMIPTIFGILPGDANLYFSSVNFSPVSPKEVPGDATIIKEAWACARQLGLDPAKLPRAKMYTHSCDAGQSVSQVCGRGVFFARYLDGISFFSAADDGSGAEGFSLEVGNHGAIQAFSVRWPDVLRCQNERTASPEAIIRSIKAHQVIVMPNFKDDDFARLKKLATAKKLTITKIALYYGEDIFGDMPTNVPSKFITPFAEIGAIADFGNGKDAVRLLAPIISSEIDSNPSPDVEH